MDETSVTPTSLSEPSPRPSPGGRGGSNSILLGRRRELWVGAIVLAVLLALPVAVTSKYWQNMIFITLIFAGMSQAWNVLGGYCGQISLGHSLYMGIGAYVSTLLYVRLGVPPTVGMFAGAAAAGLGALLVGFPCFRLSGHYYAIATVVVGEIGNQVANTWEFVGGNSGIYVPIRPESLIELQFKTNKLPFLYLALAFMALTWVVARLVEGGKWGYAWRAVRDDVVAARSLGVRVFPSKMAAAAISGALTGLGGAIYAQYVGYIDPDSIFSSQNSILIALPAVLGGVGTLWGPLLGSALLTPLSELTRSYLGGSGQGVDLMIFGGLIVLVSLARPAGIVSLFGVKRAAA